MLLSTVSPMVYHLSVGRGKAKARRFICGIEDMTAVAFVCVCVRVSKRRRGAEIVKVSKLAKKKLATL